MKLGCQGAFQWENMGANQSVVDARPWEETNNLLVSCFLPSYCRFNSSLSRHKCFPIAQCIKVHTHTLKKSLINLVIENHVCSV
jgi:hypothetical protein